MGQIQRYTPYHMGESNGAVDNRDVILYADHLEAIAAKDEQIRQLREALSYADLVLATILDERGEICTGLRTTKAMVRAALEAK